MTPLAKIKKNSTWKTIGELQQVYLESVTGKLASIDVSEQLKIISWELKGLSHPKSEELLKEKIKASKDQIDFFLNQDHKWRSRIN